jgi:hypothetical protein
MKKLSAASLAALIFSCTLFLFGPAQLFLTNSFEFNYNFAQLLPSLALITFCVFLPLALLLTLLPDRHRLFERGVAAVFVLGVLLWIQGNILVWQYGLLNGHLIDWGKKILFGLIDTPLWLAGVFLALWRPEYFSRRVRLITFLILSIQLLATSYMVVRQPESPSYKKFHIADATQFDFSSRENIILLVLDSFQSDLFQEIIEEDPAYGDYFKDFTYFRNNLGGFPSTYAAVPFLFTARYYTNSQPIQSFISEAYLSPTSVPYQLVRLGWRVDLFPLVVNSVYFDPRVISNITDRETMVETVKIAHLYDISLFRYLPHFLKRVVYNDENWLVSRWARPDIAAGSIDGAGTVQAEANFRKRRRAMRFKSRVSQPTRQLGVMMTRRTVRISADSRFVAHFLKNAAVMTERSVFKYYHWRGPHEPIKMNGDLEPAELPLTRANMKDLARGVLKLARLFLKGLKDMGVYDNSMIFILGDHGHPWGGYGVRLPATMKQGQNRGHSIPEGVLESGIPLLLVKRPGDKGNLKINDAPTILADVSATIFDKLGLDPGSTGEPLFSIPTHRQRQRRFLYYSWEHDSWMNRYLPPLVEYQVEGNSWLFSSWRPTGRVFSPAR